MYTKVRSSTHTGKSSHLVKDHPRAMLAWVAVVLNCVDFFHCAQWERFPVELFKLVAIQRSRPVISAVRTALQAMDRLPVRPPDWVDPFDDRVVAAAKRASSEALRNRAETAALTAQAGRENFGERRQGKADAGRPCLIS
jgi:hypothetical protein